MGKRIEKAFGRDKGQASAGSQENEDDPNKPPGRLRIETVLENYALYFDALCFNIFNLRSIGQLHLTCLHLLAMSRLHKICKFKEMII